ncbi:hypothetical protein YC2023_006856 [Brassica napus]
MTESRKDAAKRGEIESSWRRARVSGTAITRSSINRNNIQHGTRRVGSNKGIKPLNLPPNLIFFIAPFKRNLSTPDPTLPITQILIPQKPHLSTKIHHCLSTLLPKIRQSFNTNDDVRKVYIREKKKRLLNCSYHENVCPLMSIVNAKSLRKRRKTVMLLTHAFPCNISSIIVLPASLKSRDLIPSQSSCSSSKKFVHSTIILFLINKNSTKIR